LHKRELALEREKLEEAKKQEERARSIMRVESETTVVENGNVGVFMGESADISMVDDPIPNGHGDLCNNLGSIVVDFADETANGSVDGASLEADTSSGNVNGHARTVAEEGADDAIIPRKSRQLLASTTLSPEPYKGSDLTKEFVPNPLGKHEATDGSAADTSEEPCKVAITEAEAESSCIGIPPLNQNSRVGEDKMEEDAGTDVESTVDLQPETVLEPELSIDEATLQKFWADLVSGTSGFTVEELEQINSVLVDAVWKRRTEWDRNPIIEVLGALFTTTVKQILGARECSVDI
jgi:hypothetical protein